MADPLVVVDGDNVAHARWRGRRGRSDVPRMRAALVEAVSAWAERLGVDAVVVFDGPGTDEVLGRVRVAYSAALSGDTVIERLAYQHARERPVTVVSADRTLRHVTARGGVDLMGPRELIDRIERAAAEDDHAPAEAEARYRLGDAVPPSVRQDLERLRRPR